jgi:hypothetical protein
VPWTICYIILKTCQSVRRHVFGIVNLRRKTNSDKIRKKTIYWLDPVNILKYWPAVLTKTNRENKNVKYNIYQIVHGTKGHMAVYELGCHPQHIIWTEAKLRTIYYFVGYRPVDKLPFGPKCHELFSILYSIHENLSDNMFLLLYI